MTCPALTRKPFILLALILCACAEPVTYAPVQTVNQAVAPDNGYTPTGLPQAATNDPFGQEPPNTNQKPLTLPQEKPPIQQSGSLTSPDKLANWHSVRSVPSNPGLSSRPRSNVPVEGKKVVRPYPPLPNKAGLTDNGNGNRKKDKLTENPAIKPQQPFKPNLINVRGNQKKHLKSNINDYSTEKSQVHSTKVLDKPELTRKNSKKSIISIDNQKLLKLHFQWPLRGRITRSFSQTDNKGIDIAGKTGQTVVAAEAGKAVYCGHGLTGFGNLAIIKHNDAYLSAYANNSKLIVKEGQQVGKGQAIAQLGLTGIKKASLHFEIRRNGKPVNPLTLLPRH